METNKLSNEFAREAIIERVQNDPKFAKAIAEDYCDMIEKDQADRVSAAKFMTVVGLVLSLLGVILVVINKNI